MLAACQDPTDSRLLTGRRAWKWKRFHNFSRQVLTRSVTAVTVLGNVVVEALSHASTVPPENPAVEQTQETRGDTQSDQPSAGDSPSAP